MSEEGTGTEVNVADTKAPTAPTPVVPAVYYWGTGRRKTSVARVRLRRGKGAIVINSRDADEYFLCDRDRVRIQAPLKATKTLGKYDVIANVKGGGMSGQAGAVVLGIARALIKIDGNYETTLRNSGFLTRDSRMKERKKYGRRGARRGFQFSKR